MISNELFNVLIIQFILCRYNAANSRATVRSVVFVPSGNEAALQNAVATVGPITVAVDASLYEFQFYTGGKKQSFVL